MVGLIVHEWIAAHGGSENVVDAMVSAFPDADLRCLWSDAPGRYPATTVRESWLASTPLRRSKAASVPFMPETWRRTSVAGYDWVLVSSHLFAHHIGGRMPAAGPRKFVYVHTPARYIWTPEDDARGRHPIARLLAPRLRSIDRRRAAEGSIFAANSEFVRERIRQTWDQDATVIYPPVRVSMLQSRPAWEEALDDAERALLARLPSSFILGASRFVPYKRLDLVIKTGEAADLPVVLAGAGSQGSDLAALARQSSVPVEFIDSPSDRLLFAIFQRASLFVFPPVEDFGIMPVESMALGTPVLVNARGGARESVERLGGGAVVEDFSPSSLREAVAGALAVDIKAAQARARLEFGEEAFRTRLTEWMFGSAAEGTR
jgi:glycosyltransferase involved in cell wall biosynthesis